MLLENNTPFAAERFAISDENGKNLLVVIIKATYSFQNAGVLQLVEKQAEIEAADIYYDKPENSSILYSSDLSYDKTSTDIALVGYAYSGRGLAREVSVILHVGKLRKIVKVFGDRYWSKSLGFSSISTPEPFEKIELKYENAFGGIDISNIDTKHHEAEYRNFVGRGFRAKKSELPLEGIKLPNLEDPYDLIKSSGDRPKPAGFGFISPAWQPRLGFAGTYDEAWSKNRKPLLPDNFDLKFFNSASPDLVYEGFLNGDENVFISGVSQKGEINFNLPGVKPTAEIQLSEEEFVKLEMQIDKLFIDAGKENISIVWGGCLRISGEFIDVISVNCKLEEKGK